MNKKQRAKASKVFYYLHKIIEDDYSFARDRVETYLAKKDRRFFMNEYYNMTLDDLVYYVSNFKTLTEARNDLFNDYKPEYASAWFENLVWVLGQQEDHMNYRDFEILWNEYSSLIGSDQEEDEIARENSLLESIELVLPFKDKQEHEHWLDVTSCYKFWEDFEELTLSIAARLKVNEQLACNYWEVTKHMAQQSTFYKVFDTFREIEPDWIDFMWRFDDWFKHTLSKEDQEDYRQECEGIYGDMDQLGNKYFAFEKCTVPFFYTTDEEGKLDLIDCIFERYTDSMEDWELVEFCKKMMKGLLN